MTTLHAQLGIYTSLIRGYRSAKGGNDQQKPLLLLTRKTSALLHVRSIYGARATKAKEREQNGLAISGAVLL